jgi:hypothetical protein
MTLEYQRSEPGVYGSSAVVVLGGLSIAAGLALAALTALSLIMQALSGLAVETLLRLLPLVVILGMGVAVAYVGYGLVRRQYWAGVWGGGLCSYLAISGAWSLLSVVVSALDAISSGLVADHPTVLLGSAIVCGFLMAVVAVGFFVGRFLRSPRLVPMWVQYQRGSHAVRSVTRITVGLIVLTTLPWASGLMMMEWPPKPVAAFLVPVSLVVYLLLLAACVLRNGSLLPGTLLAVLLWHGVQWQLGRGEIHVPWVLLSAAYWFALVAYFHRELSDPDGPVAAVLVPEPQGVPNRAPDRLA